MHSTRSWTGGRRWIAVVSHNTHSQKKKETTFLSACVVGLQFQTEKTTSDSGGQLFNILAVWLLLKCRITKNVLHSNRKKNPKIYMET
jgi:hypothetical protein